MAKRRDPEMEAEIARLMEAEVEKAEEKERHMEQRLQELDEEDKEYKQISRKLSRGKAKTKRKRGHDSIFMGKKEDPIEESETSHHVLDEVTKPNAFQFDQTCDYFRQSTSSMSMAQDVELQDKIYNILVNELGVTFTKPETDEEYSSDDPKTWYYPRRKPSRTDFNYYMQQCVEKLDTKIHTHSQIFYHLSLYFSDKIINMFKLLEGKWADIIIAELVDYSRIDKSLTVKHIYQDEKGNSRSRSVDLTDMEPQ